MNTTHKVLLIEDNHLHQIIGQEMLEVFGCTVDLAKTGRAALELINQNAYDLVLLDCFLPDQTGFEVAHKIREHCGKNPKSKCPPIVAFSENLSANTEDQCIESGMDDWLMKTFRLEDMEACLNKYLLKNKVITTNAYNLGKSFMVDNTEQGQIPVDLSHLSQLNQRRHDNGPSLLEKLFEVYRLESPRLLNGLKQAINENDQKQTQFFAHSLKSSSRNMGANHLAGFCETIEFYCRENNSEQLDYNKLEEQAEIIDTELNKVIDFLKNQINNQ